MQCVRALLSARRQNGGAGAHGRGSDREDAQRRTYAALIVYYINPSIFDVESLAFNDQGRMRPIILPSISVL